MGSSSSVCFGQWRAVLAHEHHFGRNARAPAQKTLTIGPYPAISLGCARGARWSEMLARGLEPKPQDLFSRSKPAEDTRPTFERSA
jgi:hypothetical protein